MPMWIAVPDRDKELPESAFLGHVSGYKCQIISANDASQAADRASELFFQLNCPFIIAPYDPVMFIDWKNPELRKKIKTPDGEILPLNK